MITWKESTSNFKDYLRVDRSCSIHTVKNYGTDVKKLHFFAETIIDIYSPVLIKTEHLLQFLKYINKAGITVKTQSRILSGIRSFFNFLICESHIKKDPMAIIEGPKNLGIKLPDVLSESEVLKLLNSINPVDAKSIRNRAILEVLYSSGARASELLNIKIGDINIVEGIAKVSGKGSKQRYIFLGSSAVKYVLMYIDHVRNYLPKVKGEEKYLFLSKHGKRLSREMIYMIVRDAAKDVGFKINVGPHTLRHCFATHLLRGGANVMQLKDMLGHDSVASTQIYLHLNVDDLKKTIEKYHPRSCANKK